jgi:vitamin B12 transporter
MRYVLFSLVATAAVANAQEPVDTATLAPITVTATRVAVDRRAAPAAITVISGDDLRARGITRLADALRELPGASVVQSGSFGAQTGLFLRGGESDYTKVLIDGVPLNDAGGAIDLAHLTVADVERIEVVRGPASVLYGSDAVTGVIQIFTRRARERSEIDLSGRAGDYGTRQGAATLGLARGPVQVSASTTIHDTDGILAFNNAYRNRQAGASVRFAPAAGVDVSATLRHSDATYHYPTDFLGAAVDSNQYRREKRLVAAVEAGAPLARHLSAHVTVAANALDGISDNQVDRPGDIGYHDESDALRRLVDVRIDAELPRQSVLTLGAEWMGQREQNTQNFDESRINRGYYAQLLAGSGRAWLVTVGARLDDNEKFGAFVTSRVSASLRFTPTTRLRGAFGTAFKEPAFAEVFTTSFTKGNPSLEPERSRSVEAAIEQDFLAQRGRISITWFDQRFRDRVDFIPLDPQSGYFGTFANIGRAVASGLEVEGRGQVNGVVVSGSYAYLETEITRDTAGREGQRLLRRPMHTASATLAYNTKRGSITSTLLRVGSRHDVGYVRLAPYTTLDVTAEVHLLQRAAVGLALTARLENALDEQYEAIANYRAPGRTALVGGRVMLQGR